MDPRVAMIGRLGSLVRGKVAVRLALLLFAVSMATGAWVSWTSYLAEERLARQQADSWSRSLVEAAALACPDLILTEDTPGLQAYCEDLVSRPSVAYARVVRDRDGNQLAVRWSPEWADDEVVEFEAAIRVERGGERIGTFILGVSSEVWRRELRRHGLVLLLSVSAAHVFEVLLLVWLVRRMVGLPLARLDRAARRLGAGDLNRPLHLPSRDELGRLASTLDEMRQNLLRSHESLSEQNRQLRDLDRLKTEFLANMSHEIRTPIHAIMCSAELLRDGRVAPAEMAGYLTVMHRSSASLLDVVSQVLDFAKLESGNLLLDQRVCAPGALLEELAQEHRRRAEAKGLTLDLRLAADLPPWIETDPARLRQVVAGILDNAVKFTVQGGVVLTASVRQAAPEPQLVIEIQDTGPGVPDEFRARIFAPFSQADGSLARRQGGTGLGLALGKRLCQLLGGDLSLMSGPDAGTTVTITVGARPAPPPVAEPAAAPTPAAPARQARVLVVDDAPDGRRLVAMILRKAGLEVSEAEDGEVACQRVMDAGRDARPFDLVLMDVQMPVLNGLEATRRLRADGVQVPIVALTAHAMEQDRQRCLEAGCDGYATKPIRKNDLLALVQQHVGPAIAAGS